MFSKIKYNLTNDSTFSFIILVASLFFGNAIVSIAITLFCVFIFFTKKKISKYSFPILSLGIYFLANLLGVIINFIESKDVLIIHKFLLFGLIPLLFHSYIPLKISFRKIKSFYVYAAAISSLICLVYNLLFPVSEELTFDAITYKFLSRPFNVHPIYYSLYLILACIFLIDTIFDSKKNKFVSIITFIFLSTMVFFLSSRSAFFTYFVVIIIKLYFTDSVSKVIFLKSLVFITLLVMSSIVLSPKLKDRIFKLDENQLSYSGLNFRYKIWKNSFELCKKSIIKGYGYQNSRQVLQNYYKEVNFRRAFIRKLNSHNQYLQSTLDSGVIGLASLLLMLISPFLIKHTSLNFKLFVLICIIAFITESFLRRQIGIAFFVGFYLFFALENNYFGIKQNY